MGFLEITISFGLGIAANLNPCVLPLYPGYLSYISSKPGIVNKKTFTRLSGLLVLLGVLTFIVIVGAITAGFGLSINNFVSTVSPIAFGILIVLGILLIFDVNIGHLIPRIKTPGFDNPYVSTYTFGLFYGPIVIPCNAPLVFAVFALSSGIGGFFGNFLLFMAFGLGLGVPLLALSFFSAAKGSFLIRKFVKYHTPINRVAGIILIGLAIYELTFVFRIFG